MKGLVVQLFSLILPSHYYCTATFFLRDDNNYSSQAKRAEFLHKMKELDGQRRMEMEELRLREDLLAAAVPVASSHQQQQSDLPPFMRVLEQAGDDDFNYVAAQDGSAIDLTDFALKYVGCQNIHQYDDDIAQDENEKSPLAMNRFVILRLCPKASCGSYNQWGCNYNFGEYTLPMTDYLAIMAKYHVKQFDQYCSTCQACMNFEVPDNYGDDVYGDDVANDDGANQQAAAADDGGYYNDDAAADGDDKYNYNYGNRKLYNYQYKNNYYDQYADQDYNEYGYYSNNYANNNNDDGGNGNNQNNYNNGQYQYQGGYPWYINANGQCIFESVCSGYSRSCRSYSENELSYSQYFECQATQVGNSNVYTGPHCRSDGHTIGIGIYQDKNCNQYLGRELNVNGQSDNSVNFNDDDLKAYYDGTCISCTASDSFALVTDDAYGSQEYTYPLCSVLYEYSAKCNKRISIQDTYDDEEYSQAENEETVCDFIGSLVEQSYDEYGEINLNPFRVSQWYNPQEYIRVARRTSPLQVWGIVLSLMLMLGLLLYSAYLHSRLTRRSKWEPTRQSNGVVPPWQWKPSGPGDAASEAGRVSRQNSGIVRSRSIDSAAAEAQNKGAFEGEKGGTFA